MVCRLLLLLLLPAVSAACFGFYNRITIKANRAYSILCSQPSQTKRDPRENPSLCVGIWCGSTSLWLSECYPNTSHKLGYVLRLKADLVLCFGSRDHPPMLFEKEQPLYTAGGRWYLSLDVLNLTLKNTPAFTRFVNIVVRSWLYLRLQISTQSNKFLIFILKRRIYKIELIRR